MNLIELVAKLTLDDAQYEKGISGALAKSKNFAAGAGKAFLGVAGAVTKIGLAATGAAAAGVVALTKKSLDAYAEYEQLVGGVETLFKQSQSKVLAYAENAYTTAGLSANEYMDTVTSFSASLLASLGGDTEKAADVADRAITDMSDNANKMGTDMYMIQNAYQGFAKQNYTMLDNLKLGYGGTKTEMERLIKEASKMTEVQKELNLVVKAGDLSFGNIVNAISVVQKKMDITGTTAKEAASTIQGSVNSMKSAWTNLVTHLGDENADIEGYIDKLIDAVDTSMGNIAPRVEKILEGIGKGVEKLAPKLFESLPKALSKVVPGMAKAAGNIVKQTVEALSTYSPDLIKGGLDLVDGMIPGIIQGAKDIVKSLSTAIGGSGKNLGETGMKIIEGLFDFAIEGIPQIADMVSGLIEGISTAIANHSEELGQLGITLVGSILKGAGQVAGSAFMGLFATDSARAQAERHGISLWDSFVYGLKYGAEENWPAVEQAIESDIENLDPRLDKGTATKAGAEIASGVKEGVQSNLDIASAISSAIDDASIQMEVDGEKLTTNLSGFMEQVQSAMIESAGTFAEVGTAIVESVINGINEMAGSLSAAVQSIAYQAAQSAAQAVGGSLTSIATGNITYAQSAAGKSSAGVVNGMFAFNNGSQKFQDIVLNVDGKAIARATYDPTRDITKQRGYAY